MTKKIDGVAERLESSMTVDSLEIVDQEARIRRLVGEINRIVRDQGSIGRASLMETVSAADYVSSEELSVALANSECIIDADNVISSRW